jgi:hypothetical protein
MEVAIINGMSRRRFQNLSLPQFPSWKKLHTQKKPNAFVSNMKIIEFLYILHGKLTCNLALAQLLVRCIGEVFTKKYI